MDRRRLEARVLDIVDRVVAGGRAEDDLVECKTGWVEPLKGARRLAGQANAARGDDILWIVGLDEDGHRVVPLDATELANWWAQVERRFADGVTPDITVENVPTEQGTVVALGFGTDRSPYMVSADGSGGVDREIPWRTATGVRTARRGEVLSLLVEAANPPAIELLRPVLVATYFPACDRKAGLGPEPERVELRLDAEIFFERSAREGAAAMLPGHQWTARFDLGAAGAVDADMTFRHNTVSGPGPTGRAKETPYIYGATVRAAGIFVTGPDILRLEATATLPPQRRQDVANRAYVGVAIHMPVTGSPRAAAADAELRWTSGERPVDYPAGTVLGTWTAAEM